MNIFPVFNFFGGRATTFAVTFALVGIGLAVHGKLTTEFVALVGAIQTMIVAHSFKEDYFDRPEAGK